MDVEPLGDDRCRITTAEDTLPWLAFRLILLHADFEVHEPPEIWVYLEQLSERLRRASSRDRASRETGSGARLHRTVKPQVRGRE